MNISPISNRARLPVCNILGQCTYNRRIYVIDVIYYSDGSRELKYNDNTFRTLFLPGKHSSGSGVPISEKKYYNKYKDVKKINFDFYSTYE
jgi:hypothetical protein